MRGCLAWSEARCALLMALLCKATQRVSPCVTKYLDTHLFELSSCVVLVRSGLIHLGTHEGLPVFALELDTLYFEPGHELLGLRKVDLQADRALAPRNLALVSHW